MNSQVLLQASPDYIDPIRAGLARLGKRIESLTTEDLAAVDEIHARGRSATLELIELLNLNSDTRVLDLGAGIGGPARTLASSVGCSVYGIDRDTASVRTGNALSAWVGLTGNVFLEEGDVTELPYVDAWFDAAITQHVHMFLNDHAAFYAEAARVLKPGAKFAIYDPVLHDDTGFEYPVPWAQQAIEDHTLSRDELISHLEIVGFSIDQVLDVTYETISWFEESLKKQAKSLEGPPPLGLHIIMGPEFPTMARNAYTNLKNGKLSMLEVICTRRR